MQRTASLTFLAFTVTSCTFSTDDTGPAVGKNAAALSEGLEVPPGFFEAVGIVSGFSKCTGTLIAPRAVLTAGHCFHAGATTAERGSFTFIDVYPVDDPTTVDDESRPRAAEVRIEGDVILHPDFVDGRVPQSDYALLWLDAPVHDLTDVVAPIQVERPETPVISGDFVRIVGFGRTGLDCGQDGGTVKQLAHIEADLIGSEYLYIDDPRVRSCDGDSGGPAISDRNRVAGVASVSHGAFGDIEARSSYALTAPVYDWIAANACGGGFDADKPNRHLCEDPMCPCEEKEGPCDDDSECAPGLACFPNAGAHYGLPSHWGVCHAPCPRFDARRPNASFCNDPLCPCDLGEGDCDNDSQCRGNLVCGRNNGLSFGLPRSYEVCIRPGSTCGNGQPDRFEQCDDGNRRSGDGCSSSCRIEAGWTCPRFNICIRPPTKPELDNRLINRL